MVDKIKRDQAKYDEICKKRSEYALRPRKKHMLAYAADNISDNGCKCESQSESDEDILKIKYFFLFNKRICPVQSEFERFWDHYAKNGWVGGNGVLITNKVACAKNWKPEASVRRLDVCYAKAWEKLYNLLKDREKSELMVTGLYGFNLKNNTLIILCTKQLYEFVESNLNDDVGAVIRREFDCLKVGYNIVANNEEQ